jgi:hypothetical protein
MKIVIGSNTFDTYRRQDIAVQSWKKLADEFDVELYNIQFKDEEAVFNDSYNLNNIFKLERSSKDILDTDRKLPYVNDIISCISEVECDYFIFTNSDIIINDNLIKYIQQNQPTAFACSRLDIHDISSFESLRDEIKPSRWEPAGFDTFVFKREWYFKTRPLSGRNGRLFRDYFLGQPEWDAVYAGIMKMYGNNDPLGNDYPPFCFHIKHDLKWNKPSPERDFNHNNFMNHTRDRFVYNIMQYHLKMNLVRRQPYGSFLKVLSDEKKIEQDYFNSFLMK